MDDPVLSDAARDCCCGWFMFGSKATLNIGPPHANYHANKSAFDELVSAGIIAYERDARRDLHIFKGTSRAGEIARERARELLTAEGLLTPESDNG